MMKKTPLRAIAPPMRSNLSGATSSTLHPQRIGAIAEVIDGDTPYAIQQEGNSEHDRQQR
jgi:hypothetical protein